MPDDWLSDTRISYDTDATGYAEKVRGLLDESPYLRASLALFAESVREAGGGPVADVGCGPGYVTRHLHDLGVEAFGIDLSPEMIAIAQRDYPDLRFEVGTMTDLDLADHSVAGVLAFWSVIHVPDHAVPGVFGQFRRVLRPGGPLLVGFHVGDVTSHTSEGYTGRSIDVDTHRRRPDVVARWLREAGFTIEAELVMRPDEDVPGAIVFARASPASPGTAPPHSTDPTSRRRPVAEVLHAGPAGLSDLADLLKGSVASIGAWMGEYGAFEPHPSMDLSVDDLLAATEDLHERLRDNYPFFHPRYVGQMLRPPHPAAVIGYVSAMLINPNNHALDGGPATAALEKEVVADLAAMFGFTQHLGHLTSSGTIANLEALFVARETHPGKAVVHSADAHYTHGRMSHILGIEPVAVPTTGAGTMDLDALEAVLKRAEVGTVVATAGTTGLGAVDPVHEIVPLCRRYGVRVHVDAAYGGFFRLIAEDAADGVAAAPFTAIADADSVVIDPHKHGLQPYGCGAVVFADPTVARHYLHDSPYTYFTSEELHLGEISLECSRAGAAAAALWLTLRLLPLTPDGLGAVLRPGRRAALAWADLIEESDELTLYQRPQLDIVTHFPTRPRLSQIDRASTGVLNAGMSLPAPEALFVATYTVDGAGLHARGHRVDADIPTGRILRSVLMKPETETHIPAIHRQVCSLLEAMR